MTLIELTVVVLVLISLLAILFAGAKDINLRNAQQAVRGYSAMNDIPQADTSVTPVIVGGAVTRTSIFGTSDDGAGGNLRFPAAVAKVTYTIPSKINTATGVLYLVASVSELKGAIYGPKVAATWDW